VVDVSAASLPCVLLTHRSFRQSVAFFCFPITAGFIATFMFVRKIYASIKID